MTVGGGPENADPDVESNNENDHGNLKLFPPEIWDSPRATKPTLPKSFTGAVLFA